MLITWDEQTSERFIAASEYTGFHKALAKKLEQYLTHEDTLCDIGCGLGRLDIELAPYVTDILAVDISEYALETLSRDAAAAGMDNIRIHRGEAEDLEGSFDVVLMSLFGATDTLKILSHCKRRFIRIVSASKKSGLYPERHRRETKYAVPVVSEELDALGVQYGMEYWSFEFGQPLKTRREAGLFVLSNAPGAGEEEVGEFLDTNLQSTGRDDFPFYLPYSKELGIFVIDV